MTSMMLTRREFSFLLFGRKVFGIKMNGEYDPDKEII